MTAATNAADTFSTTSKGNSDVSSPPPQKYLKDVIEILGVRFVRWKADKTERSLDKQLLLYLPGIEGLGTSIEPQLPSLSKTFDVFRLIIGADDRSTFSTLSRAVSDFIDFAAAEGDRSKVVVIGESFGGMLGLRLGQIR